MFVIRVLLLEEYMEAWTYITGYFNTERIYAAWGFYNVINFYSSKFYG